MAYDSNTKIITAPVGISDLQQCFGVVLEKTVDGTTQRIVSGDLGVHAKAVVGDNVNGWTVVSRIAINKWSKHKPIKHAKITQLATADWYDGSVRAGEVYGIYQNSTPSDFPYDSNGDYVQRPWLYDRIQITDTQFAARITDFEKYYHNAPCPLQIVFQDSNNIEVSTDQQTRKNTYLSCVLTYNNGVSGYRTDDTCMALNDILLQNQSYYFAIALWRKVGNNILRYFAFADETIAEAIANHPSNPTILILMCIDDFYTAIGANNFSANDKWNCRAFLAPTRQQTISTGKLLQYADNPTDCDYKEFTITRPSSIQNIGIITLTTTIRMSGSNYYLDTFSAEINKGTLGTNSIQGYQIIGVCPTGVMKKGSTSYSELVLVDHNSPVNFTNGKITITEAAVGSSAGVFDFTNTPSSYPKMAIVRLKVTVNNKDKEVVTSTDCSTGEPPFIVTQSG